VDPVLVSCIVPVYNGAQYLRETLNSVLEQTHPRLELIVVDDGSTDATPQIVSEWGSRLIYLRQENAGTPAARNLGLSHAHGDYVSFLDADDTWHPQKSELQLDRFRARPELQLSFTFVRSFWSEDVPQGLRVSDPSTTRPVPGYVCPTMLARRQVFDQLGPFDASLAHASEPAWILEAAERNLAMEMLPQALLNRRLHLRNNSRKDLARVHAEYLGMLKTLVDRRRKGKSAIRYDFRAYAAEKRKGPPSQG
jgi:glycosyltransferase involved in cell wall biosynthesis